MKNYNRRKFIKTTTMSAAVLTAASTLSNCDNSTVIPDSKGIYMVSSPRSSSSIFLIHLKP